MTQEERLPCPFCVRTYLNADTVISHCARDHDASLNTPAAVFGSDCPTCGKTYERLPQHASVAHHRQIALLFADAQAEGDVHGVVAGRIRKYVQLVEQRLLARGSTPTDLALVSDTRPPSGQRHNRVTFPAEQPRPRR